MIKLIKEALAEFSIRDLQMDGSFRPCLSVDAQRRVYNILLRILDDTNNTE